MTSIAKHVQSFMGSITISSSGKEALWTRIPAAVIGGKAQKDRAENKATRQWPFVIALIVTSKAVREG